MSDGQLTAEAKEAIDSTKLVKTVAWLEEQRSQDKETLARLVQESDRTASQMLEFAAQIRSMSEEIRTEQEHTARFTNLGETVRQLRDKLIWLQQQVETTLTEREQDISVLQTESGRTQTALTELNQVVRDTAQRSDAVVERVNLLVHEGKNDRTIAADNSRRLETFSSRIEAFAGKLQLTEEQVRKFDARMVGLERDLGLLRTELERRTQWEQAAELRWVRQASDLQNRADAWQHSVEEQNRVINAAVKQASQVTEDVQNIYKRLAESAQQAEERTREIKRVEIMQKAVQEDLSRLKLTSEEFLGKLEAQVKNVRQVEDSARQRDEKVSGFQRALDFQQERIDTMAASLGQADQRQLTELSELLEAQQRVRARGEQIEQELETLRHGLAEQWDKVKSALNRQRLVEEQHQARQVTELQRHLQELRDSEAKS